MPYKQISLRPSAVIHKEFCAKILIFHFPLILQEEHLPNRLFQEVKGSIHCFFVIKMIFL